MVMFVSLISALAIDQATPFPNEELFSSTVGNISVSLLSSSQTTPVTHLDSVSSEDTTLKEITDVTSLNSSIQYTTVNSSNSTTKTTYETLELTSPGASIDLESAYSSASPDYRTTVNGTSVDDGRFNEHNSTALTRVSRTTPGSYSNYSTTFLSSALSWNTANVTGTSIEDVDPV